MPIAACLGIRLSPVSAKACSLMMAFGAGALLFAVTVELYGHALHEVGAGRMGMHEMYVVIFGALLGGAFYLTVNKWLEDYLSQDAQTPRQDAEKGVEKESSMLSEKKDAEDAGPKTTRSAAQLWSVARRVKIGVKMKINILARDELSRVRGRDKAMRALMDPAKAAHAKSVALALFLGLLIDGVPEGVLMGFLSAEGHLTPALIISLFIANFPEAFSASSLLIQAGMSTCTIIGMWAGLCTLVGSLAGLSCYLLLMAFPSYGHGGQNSQLPEPVLMGIALTEGITGGAMIACIAAVCLPEAYEPEKEKKEKGIHPGQFYEKSGFLCLSGFLLSAGLKALFG